MNLSESFSETSPLERIANALESSQSTKQILSEQEKLRAAYALNLCLVSVSQIVDYADLYILEQEYTCILNNLNLENIPKDEAIIFAGNHKHAVDPTMVMMSTKRIVHYMAKEELFRRRI